MSKIDRQRGAMVGLAVGDALGAAVEFEPYGAFEPVSGFRGGGPHGLDPGAWTDDTSMALALADSIAERGWDLDDQATRYVAWWREGKYSVVGHCFDIGLTTQSSLVRFMNTGDARSSGGTADHESGNGSIMRLAPVAIAFASFLPERIGDLVERAVESSLPTHGSAQCRSACVYLAAVLAGLIRGLAREAVLDPAWPPMLAARELFPFHPELAAVADGSFREKEPPEIMGSGYVVRSLEAALWAFSRAADFRDAVLSAVNLGDDADTTGAVCGQLAGACWGESGIPEDWRNGLARKDLIDGAITRLLGGEDR